jgi:hypothetical protein
MGKVTLEVTVDSNWVKIVRSPIYWVVATLQGVSITFAPLFLYKSAKGQFHSDLEWIIVPSCFALIFLIPLFYFRIGGAVITELRKPTGRA